MSAGVICGVHAELLRRAATVKTLLLESDGMALLQDYIALCTTTTTVCVARCTVPCGHGCMQAHTSQPRPC